SSRRLVAAVRKLLRRRDRASIACTGSPIGSRDDRLIVPMIFDTVAIEGCANEVRPRPVPRRARRAVLIDRCQHLARGLCWLARHPCEVEPEKGVGLERGLEI